MELDTKKSIAGYVVMFIIIFVIFLYVSSLSLYPEVSPKYASFYANLALASLVAVAALALFNYSTSEIFNLSNKIKVLIMVVKQGNTQPAIIRYGK